MLVVVVSLPMQQASPCPAAVDGPYTGADAVDTAQGAPTGNESTGGDRDSALVM